MSRKSSSRWVWTPDNDGDGDGTSFRNSGFITFKSPSSAIVCGDVAITKAAPARLQFTCNLPPKFSTQTNKHTLPAGNQELLNANLTKSK